MFNTARTHRWLTIPAAAAVLLAMVTSDSLLFLAIAPPVIALPFIVHAAARRTERATGAALTAARTTGWLMVAWGVGLHTWAVAAGVMLIAAVLMLVAAGTGIAERTQVTERRLGAATAVTGVLMAAATWPLWWWIGAEPGLLFLGSFGLVLGGAMWAIEARREPRRDEDFPAMTITA